MVVRCIISKTLISGKPAIPVYWLVEGTLNVEGSCDTLALLSRASTEPEHLAHEVLRNSIITLESACPCCRSPIWKDTQTPPPMQCIVHS